MTFQQKLIYGAVMALAVFFVGHVVLAVGSLLINLLFAVIMGAFAVIAFSLLAHLADRGKK